MPLDPRHPDLLACALARQHRLLDDHSLERALRQWLAGPPRPLVQFLADAGLNDRQRARLESEVALHAAEATVDDQYSRVRSLPATIQQLLAEGIHRGETATFRGFETRPHASGTSPAATPGGLTPAERFDVLQVHAQGGLGVVFLARDREIDRTVALKQIKSQWADDDDCRARFLLEARVTGRLEHPGVAPVYAIGADETGRPYYAMRLIRGESLFDVIERFHHGRQSQTSAVARMAELRKLLQRFLDVCNAVDYAHSKGVIHRDLKPANIMLGKFGETLVVDWGLAKLIGSDEDVALTTRMAPARAASSGGAVATQMGAAIGTPAYMSPEQAAGRIDELGPATDVYSLGATLYHLLTGRLPHDESERGGNSETADEGRAVVSPREGAPWLPRPLASICLKALASSPSERYHSARALADDVQRWLADEPVGAHHESWSEQVFRWSRNHRVLVTSLIVAQLVASFVIVATLLVREYFVAP